MKTKQDNTIADMLEASRALLAKPKGWIKGTLDNSHGGFCAIGAVRESYFSNNFHDTSKYTGAVKALGRALPKKFGMDVAIFNDNPKTRKKDILALFDKAIKLAKKSSK